MPVAEKIERMDAFHERGNMLFEEGQYARAAEQYKFALVYYEYSFPEVGCRISTGQM